MVGDVISRVPEGGFYLKVDIFLTSLGIDDYVYELRLIDGQFIIILHLLPQHNGIHIELIQIDLIHT